ncbi:SDR family oxidoreductase [Thalassospira marina]|uniref:Oxidoreductase n=1 Tax=Thalassospira marina TaxID=2048283 RepID=A0ABN5FAN3_9PROT|nr:SDR family NAD(P)-dependent oxidoreductase [Thalassospira marina]AUG51773.1 oxidoreductase [Thalassospira marina]
MKMTGNTILITGGTSGIGRALAYALDDLGNKVIVTGRREALLESIMQERPNITALPLDITSTSSLNALAETVQAHFPALNVLITNAGISAGEDMTDDNWSTSTAEDIIQTNITGVLRTVAAFLPLIKQQDNATIITTSSNLAFIPRAAFPTYCASKAFLHSWLQSLRHQLRNIPIEVLELAPPYVQTELTGSQQASDPRAMPLAEYCAEVIGLLAYGNLPNGEILVQRDNARRHAERNGEYDAFFAAMNPA